MTRQGCVSSPFSLIQNRTDDPGASFALLRRKALQPFPQTFATFASNVCNLCLKRLQPLPQTFASFASNVCILCLKRLHPLPQAFASTCKRPRKALPLSPQAFASSGIRDTPHLISFIPYPCADMPPLLCSYDSKISLLCIRIFLWLWSFLQDAPFYLLYIMQDM